VLYVTRFSAVPNFFDFFREIADRPAAEHAQSVSADAPPAQFTSAERV